MVNETNGREKFCYTTGLGVIIAVPSLLGALSSSSVSSSSSSWPGALAYCCAAHKTTLERISKLVREGEEEEKKLKDVQQSEHEFMPFT